MCPKPRAEDRQRNRRLIDQAYETGRKILTKKKKAFIAIGRADCRSKEGRSRQEGR
jgi:hypothetical protein